jgi:hypothetical protein
MLPLVPPKHAVVQSYGAMTLPGTAWPVFMRGKHTSLLEAGGVARTRVHGDEDGEGGAEGQLGALELKGLEPGRLSPLHGQDLLGHHRQHLQVDSADEGGLGYSGCMYGWNAVVSIPTVGIQQERDIQFLKCF